MHDHLDPDDALRARLRDAADRHPTSAPDVGRAISTARRRGVVRVAGTSLLVAAVATTAVAATTLLQPVQVTQPAVPADSPSPSPETSPSDVVGTSPVPTSSPQTADLADICRSQFEALANYPMYAGILTDPAPRVVHPDRAYSPGDFVGFRYGPERTQGPFGEPTAPPSGPIALCQLPTASGEAPDPTTMTPVALSDIELMSLCSEVSTRPTAPDLRRATLVQRVAAGDVVVALMEIDGRSRACSAAPLVWDMPADVWSADALDGTDDPHAVAESVAATGAAAKSIVDEAALYVTAAGTLPTDAASIRVTMPGGGSQTAAVAADGRYALALKFPGLSAIPEYTVEVLDASGAVLSAHKRGY